MESLRPILAFVGFVGFSYICLRFLLRYVTNHQYAPFILPGIAGFGILSAWVFLGWKLQDFLVWHLLFVVLLFVHWYRGNNMQRDKLTAAAKEAARRAGANEAEVVDAWLLTRWYMRLSMLSYVAAFILGFIYFFQRQGAPPAS